MNSPDDLSDLEHMPPDEAAATWLVQRDQGAVLENDPRFVSWRAASDGNLEAWNKATALWQSLDSNADPLLEAMRKDALTARRPSLVASNWRAIAASVAIVMIGGAIGWRVYGPGANAAGPVIPMDANPTFVADGARPSTFALPDGSQVTLNANAAIAVRYSADRRAVRLLRGQAFFHVIHDATRPFTTDVGESIVSDLGTDFDVRMSGHALSVTLINGSIAVATPTHHEPSIMQPGQRLDVAPGQPDRIASVSLIEVAAWRTTYIEFHDEPLDKALAEINRYGGARARIVDPSIRDIRVSGRFRTGDPARFARALAEIYPLRVIVRRDGGVDIAKR